MCRKAPCASTATASRTSLAILNSSDAPIDVIAEGDTEFIVGTAVPHRHDLVLGRYSVHTSQGRAEAR